MTLAINTIEPISVCRGNREVIRQQHISIPTGKIFLVSGPNGSGKTTLLESLFGLLPLAKGRVMIGGLMLPGTSPRQLILSGVRYLSQQPRCFPHLTVSQQRGLLKRLYRFGDSGCEFRSVPLSADSRRTSALSIGERRIESLRMLLEGSPSILLLDEPIAGLSGGRRDWIVELLRSFKAEGKTVLLSEHEATGIGSVVDGEVRLSG